MTGAEDVMSVRNFIITISREYGSGGRLIGERIAEKLGIAFYNRNLIDLTAKQSGLAETYIANWEERISSRFIWSGAMAGRGGGMPMTPQYYFNSDKMFRTQSNIIREIADKGSCVIVGRCADYVLRDREDCINVFVRAGLEHRLERLVTEYGIDPAHAKATAANTDKGRANYCKFYTDIKWGDSRHYHITLDSGRFGIECGAEIIAHAARELMER